MEKLIDGAFGLVVARDAIFLDVEEKLKDDVEMCTRH